MNFTEIRFDPDASSLFAFRFIFVCTAGRWMIADRPARAGHFSYEYMRSTANKYIFARAQTKQEAVRAVQTKGAHKIIPRRLRSTLASVFCLRIVRPFCDVSNSFPLPRSNLLLLSILADTSNGCAVSCKVRANNKNMTMDDGISFDKTEWNFICWMVSDFFHFPSDIEHSRGGRAPHNMCSIQNECNAAARYTPGVSVWLIYELGIEKGAGESDGAFSVFR